MAGGPSHLETLDYKPTLAKMNGQPMPESFTRGMPIAQLQGTKLRLPRSPAPVSAVAGQSGQEISTIFPHLATVADDICIIRSMVTEAINHDPAHTFMNTGTTISGRPAMGSWINYGLGSESDDLPGFRRADLGRPLRPGPADRLAAVAQRLPAQPVSGRAVLLQGRPGALHRPARREPRPTASATWSTPSVRSIRSKTKSSTTPRSPPGSPPTRRPSGCRPACPN